MKSFLKEIFQESDVSRLNSYGGGGCISLGNAYKVGSRNLFVKQNGDKGADIMFKGEYESLLAIKNTKTVTVPEPIKTCTGKNNEGELLIMEYIDIRYLTNYQSKLGEDLAKLHLHNINQLLKKKKKKNMIGEELHSSIDQFGFHMPTCCGFIPLDNMWCENWVEFYTRNRLQNKIDLILQDEGGDRELIEVWSELQLKLDKLFTELTVYPSLLHGDLWGGNTAESSDGPVIFDPASFYGHHEFELSITNIFGGFDSSFFKSYHSLIPKMPGFEGRHELYKCFHYLNHWNHFGAGYRGSSLTTMRKALKACNR